MKRKFVTLSVIVALFATACEPGTQQNGERQETADQTQNGGGAGIGQDMTPQDFVDRAAQGNLMEIQAGQLAAERAQSPEVREFAQMMVSHHTEANQELQQIAQQRNVNMPQSLDDDRQDDLQDLRDKQGLEFDQAYMDKMVEQHEDKMELYTDASENLQDTTFIGYAGRNLASVQAHLQQAEQLQERVEARADEADNGNGGDNATN